MIDINSETLIHIKDVPRHLPQVRRGRSIHLSTVNRWIYKGVKGIKLESVKIGGTVFTSLEALQRFAQQNSDDVPFDPNAWKVHLPQWRRKQIEKAKEQVQEILNPKKKRNGKPK